MPANTFVPTTDTAKIAADNADVRLKSKVVLGAAVGDLPRSTVPVVSRYA